MIRLCAVLLLAIPISLKAQLVEDFEEGSKGSYATGVEYLESGSWVFNDALIGSLAEDKKQGEKSVRIRNGHIAMNFDFPNGLASISFYAASFGETDNAQVQAFYSIDGGHVWYPFSEPLELTSSLQQFVFHENISGNVRIKIAKAKGDRINVDEIRITGQFDISILNSPPYETSATASTVTLQWETNVPTHSEVRFGQSVSLELGVVVDSQPKTQHRIVVGNLQPATAYHFQFRSAVGDDTLSSPRYICSTSSPLEATGEIQVFFNKHVEASFAKEAVAQGDMDFKKLLMEHLQRAEESIELAMYSFSGDVGEEIASALIDAHGRGVSIRVLVSGHTGKANPIISQLADWGIYAVQSIGKGQMHNKFAVIDAYHSTPSQTWLITGSWNATDQGTYEQYQNVLAIQDVALSRAYLLEFNQMWGGKAGAFQPQTALFGENKLVVHPSVFWIGPDSIKVQVHFSPQSNTERHIIKTLSTATNSIDLTLNLVTRRSLVNALNTRFKSGIKVRGSVASINIRGSMFGVLSSWADVHYFPQKPLGLLHHKYAIVDGERTSFNSKVITGSHNWSANANYRNDENTLILQSPAIANLFFQEFMARYRQAGGKNIFLNTNEN